MNQVNTIKNGLYRPEFEHDACGVGCVVNLDGKKSHSVVKDALTMLTNMEHRGATGSDPETGDGAGILVQLPHDFFKKQLKEFGVTLPATGSYGVGMIFFPSVYEVRDKCRQTINQCIRKMGFRLLGYRLVPVNGRVPGHESKAVEPYIEQVFVQPVDENIKEDELERKLFVLRSLLTHEVKKTVSGENGTFYMASLSSRTIIYKGQLKTDQVEKYYHDLRHADFKSALAVVHSRFSTNTFPNWKLAQPFRFIAHNGEINTIRGNVNKMKSKEALMHSALFTEEEMKWLLPVTNPENSDSANLDAMVELLTLAGRPLPHVMMMLVPEAWQDNPFMDPYRKAFYKYHAALMEPWDGPAALFFTDGKQIGATLDRNGLRPVRFCVTRQGRLVMASEAGALPVNPKDVVRRGRLQPGKMLLANLEENKIYEDEEIKQLVCNDKPYFDWISQNRIKLHQRPEPNYCLNPVSAADLRQKQKAYGYTAEDLKLIIKPMAATGKEPLGSMGSDAPLAVLSRQSQHVANYFKQHFAQVSNPPIDPIRERLVMSLFTRLGESLNVLDETPAHTRQIHISHPVLSHGDFNKIINLKSEGFEHHVVDATFPTTEKGGLQKALDIICADAEAAVRSGKKILIISNRAVQPTRAAIPSLLAVGAVHHHLIDKRIRTKTGLVVEAGDAWETHHFATIIGYGASCVYPYMVYDTIQNMLDEAKLDNSLALNYYAEKFIQAVGNGLLKILSKMGISTLQSYQSAQIFECLGFGQEVIQKCFKGTISRLEGLNFEDLEQEALIKHQAAYLDETRLLETGGFYQWRRRGEEHLLRPEVIHLLQKSTKLNDYRLYQQYSQFVREHQESTITLRSLFEFRKRQSVPLEEVEPVESIFKRFATGAMSFGSLSHEAHSTLAIAMNRIGGKSNSGEGGEDEARYIVKENGDSERSAIKQVASGRFGVTSHYLANADEIQIKIAQGAKPGEGGQLPGHKVDKWIARVRHSTPGVGLISPPPHHDIYSIEDLKQLIYDLKNANPNARINVKLVSEAGVGTIAAGVAKAKADAIMISGADGGTGASPLSSIRHAGLPWEIGLAEAHQTLVKNNLRSRVVLQTDGKLMTGYDLAVATLLGAEEFGVATAALIVEGCIMMRKCHLNTCPVGIATQNPELRQLFTGEPEHVVNLFRFMAEELREIMASLGFRTINEMVGQPQVLKVRNDLNHWKLKNLNFDPILHKEEAPVNVGIYNQIHQVHDIDNVLDRKLIRDFKKGTKEGLQYRIINVDRSVGAMLSYEVSTKHGKAGLPEDSFNATFRGSAGQTFGGFLAPGLTFRLIGEANDYLGKGLSGGKLILQPFEGTSYLPHEHIITGNVALYGATSGTAYINGMAGERFCVRNSGAEAVVEGVGDHGCEYMTGGKVLILGTVGKNFAAGMSGGMAFIYDPVNGFPDQCNLDMVDMEQPSEEDLAWIEQKLREHVAYTGSVLAQELLNGWHAHQKFFHKVMPHDLKKAMQVKESETTLNVVA
ncbi:glutamate synthase (NADH) large subunit [Pontibacter ummariensis]|uniref:Glutamate synthase [NADPH] large chain n=1 Tax=Pontibacter ummariensis TaxID=1610492 RepID=A0A239KZX6_9BACT|nr:glutamate synthase large subunit [Pontibacter ummariensis]PRY04660.1 glutamate synthase (NADH) large subunit [Pontibacter ummariensis]SNT23188.1 glutamate synthase (NADH) large subunit [Pontibacter ummariensis]